MTATRAPAGPAPPAPPAPTAATVAATWTAIGTSVRVVVTDPARLSAARDMLASDLDALDVACSRFRADSELARAERAAGTPVPVSLT